MLEDFSEAVILSCSTIWVFLKISQNLKKNTCLGDGLLIKLHAQGLQLY